MLGKFTPIAHMLAVRQPMTYGSGYFVIDGRIYPLRISPGELV